ncbi:MAG: hypothetical protein WC785_04805 [Tatlockia sp.]
MAKNEYVHHVDIPHELDDEEIALLGIILSTFPHSDNPEWQAIFTQTDYSSFPKKLLKIAANAYDSSNVYAHYGDPSILFASCHFCA